MRARTPLAAIAVGCLLILFLTSSEALGQFMGQNGKGDYGVQSASQPAPGMYLTALYLRYDGDEIIDSRGKPIEADKEGDLDVNGYALGFWAVTDYKILGGNYGFMFFPSTTNNSFEVPVLGLQEKTSYGLADTFIQPINLGWHTDRADYLAGFGIYIPTGRYDPDASDNLGMGMWGYEPAGGATVYFDKAKSWSLAATGYYEMHGKKKDTDIRVGHILTVEGGLGKSFMEGALTVGAAYYAQWKMTRDDIGAEAEEALGSPLPKHRVFGFGPDVTIPIATKTKLYGFINGRYFWETGARTTLQGRTFVVSATFPIPSVTL